MREVVCCHVRQNLLTLSVIRIWKNINFVHNVYTNNLNIFSFQTCLLWQASTMVMTVNYAWLDHWMQTLVELGTSQLV